jgi:hypothetical protein
VDELVVCGRLAEPVPKDCLGFDRAGLHDEEECASERKTSPMSCRPERCFLTPRPALIALRTPRRHLSAARLTRHWAARHDRPEHPDRFR